jgi:hypothetical protein
VCWFRLTESNPDWFSSGFHQSGSVGGWAAIDSPFCDCLCESSFVCHLTGGALTCLILSAAVTERLPRLLHAYHARPALHAPAPVQGEADWFPFSLLFERGRPPPPPPCTRAWTACRHPVFYLYLFTYDPSLARPPPASGPGEQAQAQSHKPFQITHPLCHRTVGSSPIRPPAGTPATSVPLGIATVHYPPRRCLPLPAAAARGGGGLCSFTNFFHLSQEGSVLEISPGKQWLQQPARPR